MRNWSSGWAVAFQATETSSILVFRSKLKLCRYGRVVDCCGLQIRWTQVPRRFESGYRLQFFYKCFMRIWYSGRAVACQATEASSNLAIRSSLAVIAPSDLSCGYNKPRVWSQVLPLPRFRLLF